MGKIEDRLLQAALKLFARKGFVIFEVEGGNNYYTLTKKARDLGVDSLNELVRMAQRNEIPDKDVYTFYRDHGLIRPELLVQKKEKESKGKLPKIVSIEELRRRRLT